MSNRFCLLILFYQTIISQNKNIIRLYYNEKDCYQCNQLIQLFNYIDTTTTDFHLFIKEDLKEFIHELLPFNESIRKYLKIQTVEPHFFTKKNCRKECIIPSYVVFRNTSTHDSVPLKTIGKYKKLKYFIKDKSINMSENVHSNFINEKTYSDYKINFTDSIKISEITHYFYFNGHLSISDGLLNKLHVFNINRSDNKISHKWYNFNYFPDHHFKKCNCFDTLIHNTSKMKSGNFYHPMFKKQLFHCFLNDTGFFVMLKYPYFSAEVRNDTDFLTVESKAYIYGRGYQSKKGNFICLKEDGIIHKIKEFFIQDFYYPFHLDGNFIYTKVYNENNFYDNRFMAIYKIQDSCVSSFHSFINFKHNSIDKLNKQTSIMRNNSQFYYFINDFVFLDYKKFVFYQINLKKIKHKKNSKLFIQDCMMKNHFLYVIYTDDEQKYFLIYDVKDNKIVKNHSINNQRFQKKDNILIFCPEWNKILILSKKEMEFSDIQTVIE